MSILAKRYDFLALINNDLDIRQVHKKKKTSWFVYPLLFNYKFYNFMNIQIKLTTWYIQIKYQLWEINNFRLFFIKIILKKYILFINLYQKIPPLSPTFLKAKTIMQEASQSHRRSKTSLLSHVSMHHLRHLWLRLKETISNKSRSNFE